MVHQLFRLYSYWLLLVTSSSVTIACFFCKQRFCILTIACTFWIPTNMFYCFRCMLLWLVIQVMNSKMNPSGMSRMVLLNTTVWSSKREMSSVRWDDCFVFLFRPGGPGGAGLYLYSVGIWQFLGRWHSGQYLFCSTYGFSATLFKQKQR